MITITVDAKDRVGDPSKEEAEDYVTKAITTGALRVADFVIFICDSRPDEYFIFKKRDGTGEGEWRKRGSCK